MRLQRKLMRPERLRHVYGLTDAEAALALGLADGQSLNDYALLHGLSRNYTQWLSKVIFTKLNVNSQREVVAAVDAIR